MPAVSCCPGSQGIGLGKPGSESGPWGALQAVPMECSRSRQFLQLGGGWGLSVSGHLGDTVRGLVLNAWRGMYAPIFLF